MNFIDSMEMVQQMFLPFTGDGALVAVPQRCFSMRCRNIYPFIFIIQAHSAAGRSAAGRSVAGGNVRSAVMFFQDPG